MKLGVGKKVKEVWGEIREEGRREESFGEGCSKEGKEFCKVEI